MRHDREKSGLDDLQHHHRSTSHEDTAVKQPAPQWPLHCPISALNRLNRCLRIVKLSDLRTHHNEMTWVRCGGSCLERIEAVVVRQQRVPLGRRRLSPLSDKYFHRGWLLRAGWQIADRGCPS